ncbi:MAG: chemotaxis protein CheW [Synechococcaceae cyanobacterium SM2_3_1]|nr:chemotaxis protein CheW [Synechococcaceae cyanobacterium SM2_3_1]
MTSALEDIFGLSSVEPTVLAPASNASGRFLQIQVGSTGAQTVSFLLPVAHTLGVIDHPQAQILSVPRMPAAVLGVCEWQGEMIWVVDLVPWLGMELLAQTDAPGAAPSLILVHDREQVLALAVQQMGEIETLEMKRLQSPSPGLSAPVILSMTLAYDPVTRLPVLDVPRLFQRLRSPSTSALPQLST